MIRFNRKKVPDVVDSIAIQELYDVINGPLRQGVSGLEYCRFAESLSHSIGSNAVFEITRKIE